MSPYEKALLRFHETHPDADIDAAFAIGWAGGIMFACDQMDDTAWNPGTTLEKCDDCGRGPTEIGRYGHSDGCRAAVPTLTAEANCPHGYPLRAGYANACCVAEEAPALCTHDDSSYCDEECERKAWAFKDWLTADKSNEG
jgi:hypothetical protein